MSKENQRKNRIKDLPKVERPREKQSIYEFVIFTKIFG